MQIRKFIPLCGATLLCVAASTASADIIFTLGNNPIDTDNVLFNDPALSHSGALVQGNFAGQGSDFTVAFTSSSGNQQINAPSAGQARVAGLTGNAPLSQITFGLEDNATFTGVVFNANAGTGLATVTVVEDNGDVTEFEYQLGSGQNFLTIEAVDGQRIDTVSIETTGGFRDLRQVRIGGFEPEDIGVADGGVTLIMLGLALPALARAARRFL